VNTAARIQSIAEPGSVFVDAMTRDATAAAIAYSDGGLHALKGKAEPVLVWRAERAIAGALGVNRGDGLEAELVGRDRELRLLKELFHATIDRGIARLVSVVGPAGVGKSRLAWEFDKYVDGLATNVLWHHGHCVSYGDGVAYWALAQMVRQRLGIAEQDPADVVRQRLVEGLERWVASVADRQLIEPRLAQLLGVADSDLSRDDLFGGWRLFFERLAEETPVVLLVDDVQWADAGLLEFMDSLLDWSSQHPIFVVTLARPELTERRAGWGQRRNATSIGLDPLDTCSMRVLLGELVELPPAMAERVVAQAEGIPLYAVEIVRALLDRGAVADDDGRRRVVAAIGDIQVPATLTALLVARLDGLPPDERMLVRDLAVLGTSFPREAVDAVAQPTGTPLDALLTSLIRKEVLTVLSDPLSPERGHLQFAQGLMRTVVYDNLTRRERKARHVAVAAHLQRAFTDDGAEVAEVIAVHYRQALEADPDAVDAAELRRDAAAAYRRAGDRAAGLGASDAATNSYRSALDFVDEADGRAELLHTAGVVAGRAARFDEAIPMLEEAIAALDGLGRASDMREAAAALDRVLCDAGHNIEADNRMQAALAALPADATDYGTAVLLVQAASRRIAEGRVDDETAALLDRAIALAEGLGDRRLLAQALNYLGVAHLVRGNSETARVLLSAAVDRARSLDDLDLLVSALNNYGQVLVGADEPADEVLDEVLAVARRLGSSNVIGLAAGNRVRSLLRSGHWDRAADVARTAHHDVGETGTAAAADSVRWLAVLAAWRGNHDEARQLRAAANVAVEDPQDAALDDCNDVILRHASGDHDDLVGRVIELLERDTATFGWRFDTPPLLWPIGIDTALATGDHAAAQRLIDMLAAVQPGHRPPSLSAELVRAGARLAIAHGDSDVDVEAHLGDAIERFAALGQPVPDAAARLDLHDWLRANGRHDEAEQVAEPAIATAHRLGAAALLTRVDAAEAQIG
jgi:predicted ATPase